MGDKKPATPTDGKPSAGGKGLTLEPGRALRLGLLFALLPLIAATWCAIGWDSGPILRSGAGDLRLGATWGHLGTLLLGVAVLVAAVWLFWPLAQWLRRSSLDLFTRRKVVGSLPLILALPLWLTFYAAAALALATGALVLWQSLAHLGLQERLRHLLG